jgi:gamma-glutamylcyclotransferase (GGCT)/AIG2-like uncharacterized protein YtfP
VDRHLLFFYGTLMSGHGRGNVLTGRQTNVGVIDLATFVARGTIRGVMHDAGGGAFPALVDGDGVVHGEVWEAPTPQHLAAALVITDGIEGYREGGVNNLYDRIGVPLLSVEQQRADFALIEPGDTVLTYRWGDSTRYLGPVVPSGDWRSYEREGSAWSAA